MKNSRSNHKERRAKRKLLERLVGRFRSKIIGSATLVLSTDQDFKKDGAIQEDKLLVSSECTRNGHVAKAVTVMGLHVFYGAIDQHVRREIREKFDKDVAELAEREEITVKEAQERLKDKDYDIPVYDKYTVAQELVDVAYNQYKAEMTPLYGKDLVVKEQITPAIPTDAAMVSDEQPRMVNEGQPVKLVR